MNSSVVLKIDKSGRPLRWISKEMATSLVCSGKVLWSFGDHRITMRGGYNRLGERSVIHLSPIVAVDGIVKKHAINIPLMNKYLFRRDQQLCMYCGQRFGREHLTRDHIMPRSRGGKDVWTNVVAACRCCNQRYTLVTKLKKLPKWVSIKSFELFRFVMKKAQKAEQKIPFQMSSPGYFLAPQLPVFAAETR